MAKLLPPATNVRASPSIFMMDLLATVPYYTAYLSRALLAKHVRLQIGSITYYLDRECFGSRGLSLDPGALDLTSRFDLPRPLRRLAKLAEALLNLLALSVRFLVSPPDIIHVQYLPMLRWPLPFDLWFVLLLQRRGSALLLTVHDLLPHDTGEAHQRVFHRLYHRADALICHSAAVRERLQAEFAIPEDRITVIPHGPFFFDLTPGDTSDTRSDLGIPAGAFVALWQGIIFPYKGVDLLLTAWAKVEQAGSSAHLVIAGTGSPDLLGAISAQIGSLGLTRVTLLPRFVSATELVALYRLADVVLYPYRAITTSGALSTGLALGKVIIASDLPVFRELLTHRQDALLVDPTDPAQLAAAILELQRDPALRAQFSAAIRSMRFAEGAWSGIADQTIRVYNSLVPGSRS